MHSKWFHNALLIKFLFVLQKCRVSESEVHHALLSGDQQDQLVIAYNLIMDNKRIADETEKLQIRDFFVASSPPVESFMLVGCHLQGFSLSVRNSEHPKLISFCASILRMPCELLPHIVIYINIFVFHSLIYEAIQLNSECVSYCCVKNFTKFMMHFCISYELLVV